MKMTFMVIPAEMNVRNASISEQVNADYPINLPHHLKEINQIGIDIGGSLIKVVFFRNGGPKSGGTLVFKKFDGACLVECTQFVNQIIREKQSSEQISVYATGGGAHKHYEYLYSNINGLVFAEDEMECLISGVYFLATKIPFESFEYSTPVQYQPIVSDEDLFPYLLVNIGSGVSIIKVEQNGDYERISGTSLGGGTLWGMLSMLTDVESFDEMLELSLKGNNRNVDLLVGDIYGSDYHKIGLKSSTIASTMGKTFKVSKNERNAFKPEDIAASLLYMVANNIGQIAYLNAQIHNVKNIYFGGFFIRNHAITMNAISYAINFWSKGEKKALFLKHEGYLGCIGAFLTNQHITHRNSLLEREDQSNK